MSEIAPQLNDWGFYYPPEYVLPRFKLWYSTGFVVMPRAGGYDDQDPKLMADLGTCMLIKTVLEDDSPPATSINISKMENPPI